MAERDYRNVGAELDDLKKRVSVLEAILARNPTAQPTSLPNELDGKYGNPLVRNDPPKWTGPSQRGKPYSHCPPDFLESLAGFLEWQAKKDDEQNRVDSKQRLTSTFKRLDARRARGWALRIKSGWQQGGSQDTSLVPVPRAQDYTAPPLDLSNDPANDVVDFGGTGTDDDDIPF